MKKFILGVLSAMIIMNNAAAEEKILPQPQTEGGIPLMQAFNQRRAVRSFDKQKPIDEQTLSNLLWAAYGISGEEGRRTIPTAKNEKDLEVYVADRNGAWLYDAENNKLIQVTDKDISKYFTLQDYVADAALELIFVGSKDGKFADMHAGSAYQNAGLYAASVGLNNVVRAWVEVDNIAKALNLPADKRVIITQAFGWGK